MADLIDREKILNDILKLQGYYWSLTNKKTEVETIAEVIERIRNSPPADTERHAHWIYSYDELLDTGKYTCSNCKEYDFYSPNYCPECGCRMDEVSE